MHKAKSGVPQKLKQQQPRPKQNQEKALIRQLFPAANKFLAEFLKDSVFKWWIARLRVYSTLFDSELEYYAQLNSALSIRNDREKIRRDRSIVTWDVAIELRGYCLSVQRRLSITLPKSLV